MKNTIFPLLSILLLCSACSKKKRSGMSNESYQPPKYDTLAIDSFSSGAVNVDIAAKIRMEEEKRLKALLDKEEEKKKQEENKKAQSSETSVPENTDPHQTKAQ